MAVIRALFDATFGRMKPLGRINGHSDQTLSVFFIPCGDCNGCILEVLALRGAAFDIATSGIVFVDHPASANILLITGLLTRPMIPYLERNWELMPHPKAIVTIGACAIDKGVFEDNYAVLKENTGGEDCVLQIEGCPPAPMQIMGGLLKLLSSADQGDYSDLHPQHQPLYEEPQHQPLSDENSDSLGE